MKALYITKKRAQELGILTSIDPQTYAALIGNISSLPISSSIGRLQKFFEEHLDDAESEILLRHMVSLSAFCDKEDCEPSEAFDALREGLVNYGWDENQTQELDIVKKNLLDILSNDVVYLTTKAGQLFAADQNHLHSAKAIADIRPIFGRKRENIRASLVYSTLSLVFSDSSENETSIAIALRYDDLERLRGECDRAMQKIHAIRELRNEALGTLLVHGESDS